MLYGRNNLSHAREVSALVDVKEIRLAVKWKVKVYTPLRVGNDVARNEVVLSFSQVRRFLVYLSSGRARTRAPARVLHLHRCAPVHHMRKYQSGEEKNEKRENEEKDVQERRMLLEG